MVRMCASTREGGGGEGEREHGSSRHDGGLAVVDAVWSVLPGRHPAPAPGLHRACSDLSGMLNAED